MELYKRWLQRLTARAVSAHPHEGEKGELAGQMSIWRGRNTGKGGEQT